EATWNALCLADFGDGGVAFVAQPQLPPRNVNWASEGKWVHLAKIGFEKYFLRKVRKGESEPFYERLALHVMGIRKLRFWSGRKQRRSMNDDAGSCRNGFRGFRGVARHRAVASRPSLVAGSERLCRNQCYPGQLHGVLPG